uniref:ATP-binding protein n=1 Tax=Roseofilum reptotaenium TaxID=1233427 RepID=UPI000AADD45C|nr:hypothetical protein [Roseofilum reptotaenium]
MGATIHTITLEPLMKADLNRLVADTLSCTQEIAQPLTELVYQKTKGNPFFATQFLKGLHEDGWIVFDRDLGYWHCDLTTVQQLALTDDVVEFMATRLHKLPEETQEILKLAACIGNQFDLETLAIVSELEQIEAADSLWKALQEGLVLPLSQTYQFFQRNEVEEKVQVSETLVSYKFLHDRVQQAAYSLIPQNQKQVTHLNIGRSLVNKIPKNEWEERIFDFIDHLNLGVSLIDRQPEREQLIQLNLMAGCKAKSTTAYSVALSYLTRAIELLPDRCWDLHYDLTLNIYENAAEAAYLSREFEQQQEFTQIVLHRCDRILDRIKVYQVEIESKIAQIQKLEAIQLGLDVLQNLGIDFPAEPTPELIQQALTDTQSLLADIDIQTLADLPPMTDEKSLAALKIMVSIVPAIAQSSPAYFPLITCEEIRLSIQYGDSPFASCGYADFALILSLDGGEVAPAAQLVKLAIEQTRKKQAIVAKSSVLYKIASFIIPRQRLLTESLPLLLEAYRSALESGNLAYAGYSITEVCQYAYLGGRTLPDIQEQLVIYGHALNQIKQDNTRLYNRCLLRLCPLGRESQNRST